MPLSAETRQRKRRKAVLWWTVQLRAERNLHNIPFLVTCVSPIGRKQQKNVLFSRSLFSLPFFISKSLSAEGFL